MSSLNQIILSHRNEGPRKERENLLILDSIEDWLGRRRPLIFGKDGIQAGRERGETTLADILNRDDDSFGVTEKENDAEKSQTDNWVDGIGEGRSDESNLSAYYRMSEGEDDETSWRLDGLVDLSPHQNIAVILGNAQSVSLRPTTSSVDEGEPGKVKSLYDIVFSSDRNEASCLSIPSYRGGSLDVGVLHTVNNENRKKASYEFWFFLPSQGFLSDIVLIRRTMGSSADNIESMDSAFKTTNAIWELVLQPSGLLEFRTCGGSTFLSSQRDSKRSSSETDQENEKPFLAATDRWNHVCLVLNSKGLDVSDCIVTLFMKGIEVASMKTSMLPPNMSRKDVEKDIQHAGIVDKSLLLYGLHHNSGFRLTEIRVWACERSAADTQTFLFEYLIAAEQKKKFKVKIANKNKKGPALGKGLGLAPPKGIPVATNKGVALPGPSQREPSMGVSLVPPPKEEHSFSLKPAKQQAAMTFAPSIVDEKISQKQDVLSGSETSHIYPDSSQLASPKDFPEKRQLFESSLLSPATDNHQLEDPVENFEDSSQNVAATLWDTAVPLSQQLRPSAAAALIRGPPATRHYGGNRGGLPDYSGVERFGVGGIAVCGSEKTIVFRDNEDPPALTYPIGASGAVISDHMDDEGSEFLCCFLAKEGRMVVFELRSRTVVVELQMTTKLNFWRYLPPEAAGNTLCFMLVTPVGGFHWKPLEESPRPHQVWKRGSDLQGKKVVGYEEGGSNGLDGADICSRVGLITVTRSSGGSSLEGWLLPISGSSKAHLVSDDLLGACLCQPLIEDDGPFLPFLVTVNSIDDDLLVNAFDITEKVAGSLSVGEVHASQTIDESEIGQIIFEPPALAMGPLPEALCVSLANIIVVVLRRKGLVAAFELEDGEINTIAMESVDHFVIDAVMRYSSDFGGAEIVMLLSDETNPKDGRIVSFCFRSAA